LENWFELEFLLLKIVRLQPSELDKMEFYRAEILIENLKKFSEKEGEQRKKEEESQQKSMSMQSPSSMMRDAQKSLPKVSMPKIPKLY
jgi:hypothetical protein